MLARKDWLRSRAAMQQVERYWRNRPPYQAGACEASPPAIFGSPFIGGLISIRAELVV
jgi:hypothetical protein